tara:strand:- start:4012 stop:5220 length:1209 start_codon:yes stop_codon:yes gene_type:complete
MNQVFVSNHMSGISDNSHQDWSTLAHTTGAAAGHDTCMVGIWDPRNLRFLDGTTAALGLVSPRSIAAIGQAGKGWADIMDDETASRVLDADGIAIDTAADEAINTVLSSPNWLNQAFQIVQALPNGNPIASPIINTSQVKRLRYDFNVEPVAHVQTVADAGLSSIAVGDTLQAIFSIRFPGDIAFYEAQINPSGSVTNVTPALSAAFDNPKKIYKSTIYTAASTTVATEHNAFVDAIIADTSNSILDFVTVTESSNDLVATAKFFGLVIDVFVLKNGERSHGVSGETAMKKGVGSFAEVLSAEKKAQYSQGHFNRMYLPTGGLTHASATAGGLSSQTALYNRLVIEYENANGTMPGFNRAGNTSTATLYTPVATFADDDTGRALEATFGLLDATDTNTEFIW